MDGNGTRVLLVDDHRVLLDGLRAFLERQPGISVVGTAVDGLEALRIARDRMPHVVIMDVSIPGMNGIEATRRITAELKGIKVICLSMHAEKRFLAAALEAGAAGYLVKENSSEELVKAIRTVRQNMTYLSPTIAGTVVEDYIATRRSGSEASAFSTLTTREREVLQLIAEGRSTKEIAQRLRLSVKTISTHREHVMEKLGVRSLAGLTKYAIRQGLTSIEG